MMKTLLAAFSLVCAGWACAQEIPLDAAHWNDRNPLGGDFVGGCYECLAAGSYWLAEARDLPLSSNIVFSAEFTPTATDGDSWKTAAVSLRETPKRFWHMALLEQPAPRNTHTFELNEMRDGVWCSHNSLKVEVNEEKGKWQFGQTYRLTILMDGKAVEGRVETADGACIFRRRFRLKKGAVGCGSPCLKGYAFRGVYNKAMVEWRGVVPRVKTAEAGDIVLPGAYWKVQQDDEGRWNFVSPEGKSDFLAGCSSLSWAGDYNFKLGYAPYGRTVVRKYGTPEKWAKACAERLRDWGFSYATADAHFFKNTDFSYSGFVSLGTDMASAEGEYSILACDGGPCTAFPNVFSPKWEAFCNYRAWQICRPSCNDKRLVGWFIDNELAWWGDRRQFRTPPARGLYDAALKLPPEHSARKAAEAFASQRGFADATKADLETCRAFVGLCAERYFAIATKAIRAADPNHIILGCRFAGIRSSDPVVWEACGRHCDVLSVNLYADADLTRKAVYNGGGSKAPLVEEALAEVHRVAGKPLMITEWSFSALDSGVPCLHGAGQRFITQKERAEAVSLFARTMYGLPYMAGYLFFKWSDQPYYGRKSEKSENTNYGLVNANDEPYAEVTAALKEVQRNGAKWRKTAPPRGITVVFPTAEAAARKACRANAQVPRFTQAEDGAFVAENGFVRITGKAGETALAVNDVANYTTMLRNYARRGQMDWTGASKVVSVEGAVREGVVVLDVVLAEAHGLFRMKERLYLPAGTPYFIAEHVAVENTSSQNFPFDQLFFRLVPKDRRDVRVVQDGFLAPPKDGQPTPIPPSLWRPWQSGAWVTPTMFCGVAAPRGTSVSINYWKDRNMHTDASFRVAKRVNLAPSAVYTLSDRPYVYGAAEKGGEADWVRLFAEMRK